MTKDELRKFCADRYERHGYHADEQTIENFVNYYWESIEEGFNDIRKLYTAEGLPPKEERNDHFRLMLGDKPIAVVKFHYDTIDDLYVDKIVVDSIMEIVK